MNTRDASVDTVVLRRKSIVGRLAAWLWAPNRDSWILRIEPASKRLVVLAAKSVRKVPSEHEMQVAFDLQDIVEASMLSYRIQWTSSSATKGHKLALRLSGPQRDTLLHSLSLLINHLSPEQAAKEWLINYERSRESFLVTWAEDYEPSLLEVIKTLRLLTNMQIQSGGNESIEIDFSQSGTMGEVELKKSIAQACALGHGPLTLLTLTSVMKLRLEEARTLIAEATLGTC